RSESRKGGSQPSIREGPYGTGSCGRRRSFADRDDRRIEPPDDVEERCSRDVWKRPAATVGRGKRRSGAATDPGTSSQSGTTRHMANLVKDDLAMRLTFLTKRLTRAAVVVAWAASAGCQRLPYIDQSKEVPHEPLGTIAQEDKEVKQAQFLGNLPLPLPRIAKPRTTGDPEAAEIWQMPLNEAIRIGLDNSEVVRVISLGAQGIPVGGFEPTPLNVGGAGISSALGASPLQTVYDPAIQETQIAQALSSFDTNFTTSLLWGHSVAPFNNAIQAGTFLAGPRFPIIFNQDTAQFQTGVQKRTATGAQPGVTHNINYLYSNSPTNATPSAYTTNLQLSLTQPLLGSAPLAGGQAGPPVGLEANRAPIVIARLNADAAVWRLKAEIRAQVRPTQHPYRSP